jgi:hypothetical protein
MYRDPILPGELNEAVAERAWSIARRLLEQEPQLRAAVLATLDGVNTPAARAEVRRGLLAGWADDDPALLAGLIKQEDLGLEHLALLTSWSQRPERRVRRAVLGKLVTLPVDAVAPVLLGWLPSPGVGTPASAARAELERELAQATDSKRQYALLSELRSLGPAASSVLAILRFRERPDVGEPVRGYAVYELSEMLL